MTKTFSHSGARGDIIYGLPTIRALGGGILHIKQDPACYKSRPLCDKDIDWFKELLCTQNYIDDVKRWDTGLKVNFNLDRFRDNYSDFISLAKLHLMAFNVYTDLREPWIEPSTMQPKHVADIVVNRSERYHGPFDWGVLVDWQDSCAFIGLEQEYKEFVRITGLSRIKYSGECSYKELAETILGSKLFIGNQSFPFSLAEAMKHPRVLEVLPLAPNCLPQGPHGHTRLTSNIIKHYLYGNFLQEEVTLSYYQPIQPVNPRTLKTVSPVSYIIPALEGKSHSEFIEKATVDGSEVIVPVSSADSFEERANIGAAASHGDVLCVIDLRKDVNFLSAYRLASQLGGKEGLIGICLNTCYSRPYMGGEYIAVSRKAYEECGLFNLHMLSGELNHLEMNLRYTRKRYACRSGGQMQSTVVLDSNFDRNASYIYKMYGVRV